MTKLDELMAKGIVVQISTLVDPGTFYSYKDANPLVDGPERDVVVMNILDYNYIAYDDPFEAHRQNMQLLETDIVLEAQRAMARLDEMVKELETRHDPHIYLFSGETEIMEHEDGSFSLTVGSLSSAKKALSEEYLKGYI